MFLSECWLNVNTNIDLEGYNSIAVPRKRCRGGGLVLFFKDYLNDKISEHDSIVWIRCDKSLCVDCMDTYICFVYFPPDRSEFYSVYECDLFQVLEEHIECFKHQGHVILTGDFNGRVGHESDFIENDNTRFGDISCVPKLFDYESDVYCKRNSEDEKVNTIGRCILNLCISSGVRILNGRSAGDCKGKITFYNKNGTSVIDYCIVDKYSFDIIQDFYVGDFNTYSDHAPIFVSLMKQYSINKCTCKNVSKTYIYI